MGGLAKAEIGPVTERPKGSRQPLSKTSRTHNVGSWRAVAAMIALRNAHSTEMAAARFSLRCSTAAARNRDEALIRGGFAHRFFVASQEACASKRAATIEQLKGEQEAALQTRRARAIAEEFAEVAQTIARLRTRHGEERRTLSASLRQQRRGPRTGPHPRQEPGSR